MAFKLLNRVRMSVLGAAGTGTITLNAAAVGFQEFSTAGLTDGDTTPYVIEDGSPIGSEWEIGLGTYSSGGTIARTTVTASSLGGATKISATANAIISGTFRGVDILGQGTDGSGGGAGTAPIVVQYKYTSGAPAGLIQAVLDFTPKAGNIIVAMGNSADSNGASGFNFTTADYQYNQNNTTAYKVGWGWKLVTSTNAALSRVPFIGSSGAGKFSWLVMEIAGATIGSAAYANGVLASGSSTTQAANAANSLGVIFEGGDGGASPSITAPAAFQISAYSATFYSIKAGWNTLSGSGNAGLTGSVSSGSNGVLALNIPGV
jgi:hypothetical protein